MAAAKARGAKRAVLLPVSAPLHCALMKPAAERLQQRLVDIEVACSWRSRCSTTWMSRSRPTRRIRMPSCARLIRRSAGSRRCRNAGRRGATVTWCGQQVLVGMNKRIEGSISGPGQGHRRMPGASQGSQNPGSCIPDGGVAMSVGSARGLQVALVTGVRGILALSWGVWGDREPF